jgi:hypothetical protein
MLYGLSRTKLTAPIDILSENGRHEDAAWLYDQASEARKAAREYCEIQNHEKVLATCYHGNLYEQLISYLKK